MWDNVERRRAQRGDRPAGASLQQFLAGDRISVPGFVGGSGFSERRIGTIVESYEGSPTSHGRRVQFYAVRWDDCPEVVDRGHIGVRFRLEGEAT